MWGDAVVMRGDSGYAGAMEEEAGTMWRDAVAVWEESRAMLGDRYCRLPFCPRPSFSQSSG